MTPDYEFDEGEDRRTRLFSSASCRRQVRGERILFDAPRWVKILFAMPGLRWLALRWIDSHLWRSGPPPSGRGDDQRGVREPRRPRPFAGAGAVEVEVPREDVDDWRADYVFVGRDEPAAPTTAA